MKKIHSCFWQAVDTKYCEGVSLFAKSDILGTHVRHRVVSTACRRNVISFNVVGVGWAKKRSCTMHTCVRRECYALTRSCTSAYLRNATF